MRGVYYPCVLHQISRNAPSVIGVVFVVQLTVCKCAAAHIRTITHIVGNTAVGRNQRSKPIVTVRRAYNPIRNLDLLLEIGADRINSNTRLEIQFHDIIAGVATIGDWVDHNDNVCGIRGNYIILKCLNRR